MGNFSQHNIQRMYQVWARMYEWLTPLYLLGNEGRLRRKVIRAMNLEPGQTVIDIACGTGRNFPLILNKIGPTGHLVGVDYTPAMLERARQRVVHEGWENVQLVQGNAARISIDQQFDAALCTLAMSVIPDYESALKVMVNHVRTGGRVAIADAKLSTNWYARPLNWFVIVLGWGAAADITRHPWAVMEKMVDDFIYRQWFMGFFYLASGRVLD